MWLPPTAYFKRLWDTVALLWLIKVNGGFFPFKKALSIVKKPWGHNPSGLPNRQEKFSKSDGPSRRYFSCDSSSSNNNDHIVLFCFVFSLQNAILSLRIELKDLILWGQHAADCAKALTRNVLSFFLRDFAATLMIFPSSVKSTYLLDPVGWKFCFGQWSNEVSVKGCHVLFPQWFLAGQRWCSYQCAQGTWGFGSL